MERDVTEKRSGAWELEQLNQLFQYRPDLVSAALRRLMEQDAELRWALVVTAYLNRQVNLGKAAEMLDVHELELRDRFVKLGIPLRVGAADLAEAQAEVQAVRTWFSDLPTAK
jgi:predicted HTH domain antitoxin